MKRLQPRVLARLLAPLAAALVAVAAGLAAGQQAPTFHAGTNTVSVYATVTERDGRLSPYLDKDDFSVYDNGKPQPLTVFSRDVQPITIVIMLDRSGSMTPSFELERNAARAFIGRLNPADRARVGSFADQVRIDPATFTSDPEELQRILQENLQDAGMTPLWNATTEAMTALAHEQGRRVVLVFTDGADNPGSSGVEKNMTLPQVQERAQADEIMIYSVGLAACGPPEGKARGDAGPLPILFQGRGGPGRGGPPVIVVGGRRPGGPGRGGAGRGGGRAGPGGRGGGPGDAAPPCATAKPDPGLDKLARDSGGRYLQLDRTNDLSSTFARIADELHRQYVLGFTAPKLDGKVHKIDVRVREAELTVRARQSYLAPLAGSVR